MPTDQAEHWAASLGPLATAVLSDEGTVLRWSSAAADLVGRTAGEVCGQPVWKLLADAPTVVPCEAGIPAAGQARLGLRSGDSIDVTFWVTRLEPSSEFLILATPARCVTEWAQGVSLLRSFLAQDRVGVGICDTNLNIVRANTAADMPGGPPLFRGSQLQKVMSTTGAEAVLRQVLATGIPVIGKEQRVRPPHVSERERTLSLSAFRLENAQGAPAGVAAIFADITAQERVRRHLQLLHEAGARIGISLDVTQCAQDLVDVLVPAFADLASVDLAEAVLDGDEPPKTLGGGQTHQRRIAVAAASGTWPAGLLSPGESVAALPDHPSLRAIQHGETLIIEPEWARAQLNDSELIKLYVPERGHSLAASPLFARGLLLGGVSVWRTDRPEPFGTEDADLLKGIASRASLSVDNARRYTRERRAAIALQQQLLPRTVTSTAAAETEGFYLPADNEAEISGDWFDVLALPSLRTALVVGDVVGRGLHATATMGSLRTAVSTLADLELDPTEVLTRLDDRVQHLAKETDPDPVGATCLYAVYDPVTRHCTLASAGHPPPIVIRPDGTAQLVEVSVGPPLGVGGMPFETTEIDLDPGSVLALYTDGLIAEDNCDFEIGIRRLRDKLVTLCRTGQALGRIGNTLLADAPRSSHRDDIVLLLARTRGLPDDAVAEWEFPADPAVVADAREAVTRQLAEWGLDELAFTTEMVASELVTNAVRYAGGPIRLRLIREDVLVCEVTDPSNTQPRLRRALWTDEGGRGLYLVAQLTARWGSRYGQRGKTIWTEQSILKAGDRTTPSEHATNP